MPSNWFVDFDDTLVKGSTTWGLEVGFPQLIRENQLPYDEALFKEVALLAQEQVNQNPDPEASLADMFTRLSWPKSLVGTFLQDLVTTYQPQLFDDALPFLKRLQASGDSVVVISNNPYAPEIAQQLGITPYIRMFFTPKLYPGSRPKPDRSLWDCVLQAFPDMDHQKSVILGDDPWSEGIFAENCGVACWIIDRRQMFTPLYGKKPYQWIYSLLDSPPITA